MKPSQRAAHWTTSLLAVSFLLLSCTPSKNSPAQDRSFSKAASAETETQRKSDFLWWYWTKESRTAASVLLLGQDGPMYQDLANDGLDLARFNEGFPCSFAQRNSSILVSHHSALFEVEKGCDVLELQRVLAKRYPLVKILAAHRSEKKLNDMANVLGQDWEKFAELAQSLDQSGSVFLDMRKQGEEEPENKNRYSLHALRELRKLPGFEKHNRHSRSAYLEDLLKEAEASEALLKSFVNLSNDLRSRIKEISKEKGNSTDLKYKVTLKMDCGNKPYVEHYNTNAGEMRWAPIAGSRFASLILWTTLLRAIDNRGVDAVLDTCVLRKDPVIQQL